MRTWLAKLPYAVHVATHGCKTPALDTDTTKATMPEMPETRAETFDKLRRIIMRGLKFCSRPLKFCLTQLRNATKATLLGTRAETLDKWRRTIMRYLKSDFRTLKSFLTQLRNAIKTTLLEIRAETLDKWRRYIMRGLTYSLLYVFQYVFEDFFAKSLEVPEYFWFIIISLRLVFFLIRFIPVRVSSERKKRMKLQVYDIPLLWNYAALIWNLKFFWCACVDCYYLRNPTVFDYFAIARSLACGGY